MGEWASNGGAGAGAATAGIPESATAGAGGMSSIAPASAEWAPPSWTPPESAGNIPTDGTSVSLTPNQAANVSEYGTPNPTMLDKAGAVYDRFTQGQQNSMVKAYNKFGNNPETYGYLYQKLSGLSGIGSNRGGGQPVTFNISSQQPSSDPMSDYYRRRR